MEEKILTIKKIAISGKYTEFWMEEKTERKKEWDIENNCLGDEEIETWSKSCKSYIFNNAIDHAKLFDHVLNHGVVGLKTVWEFNYPNWNLKEVYNQKSL